MQAGSPSRWRSTRRYPDKTTRVALKRLSDLLGGPQDAAETDDIDPAEADAHPLATGRVGTLRYGVAVRASKRGKLDNPTGP
jgi:hypothetical protein